jgi:SAM-dependent methyltransferase
MDRRKHWEAVYERKQPHEVSWHQTRPNLSLQLIAASGITPEARILDVGGGTSTLIDNLLEVGYTRLGVLDVAEAALGQARDRLGGAARRVEWFTADVTTFVSPHQWDLWHDRAVFHFLIDPADRRAYRETMLRSLAPGGHLIVATFGPDGPTRCSGLDVVRYDADMLSREFGPTIRLVETQLEQHETPSGAAQQFLYARFQHSMTGDRT